MDHCCSDKVCALDQLRDRQTSTLRIVLAANAGMFVVELVCGLVASSVALLADSLDMLGDALVYGFSLYVVAKGATWKARAAQVKAGVMALFGIFVLGQVIYKLVTMHPPTPQIMGVVGFLALAVNSICFALLWRHRAEDINMRSVWLCSRNDLVANASVIGAAVAVYITASHWPDIVVGAFLCVLFMRSAYVVYREASVELRRSIAPPAAVTVSFMRQIRKTKPR